MYENLLDQYRVKPTYTDLTKQRAQTLLDSVLIKNQEAEAEEAKRQEQEQQKLTLGDLPAVSGIKRDVQPVERPKKIGETEQSRPTVGDTPSGVLDGLIRPLSAQEQANRERMYAARQGVAGLGNGLAALANVLYTGAGATPQQIPDIPDAGGQQLLSWQDRLQERLERAWQQQMAEKEFNQGVADADRKFNKDVADTEWEHGYRKNVFDKDVEDTEWNHNFQESEAERDQKNIEDRNAETKRSNMANEKTNLIRAEKSGSGSGSSSGNNFGHPLKGYGGSTVNVNNTRINNDAAETAIGNEIPEKYKKEWNTAKAGAGRKSKTDVIQEAMQNSKEFQKWMIDHKYAQLSDVQDEPQQDNGVLDLGDDEDVFNGSDFQ